MDIRINNVLDLQLRNEDVDSFIHIFGHLKSTIEKSSKITLEFEEETLEFIQRFCDTAGIFTESEIKEMQKDQEG